MLLCLYRKFNSDVWSHVKTQTEHLQVFSAEMSGLLWGAETCRNSKQYLLVSKWAEVDSGNSVLTIKPHAREPDTILANSPNVSTCGTT